MPNIQQELHLLLQCTQSYQKEKHALKTASAVLHALQLKLGKYNPLLFQALRRA